MEKMGGGEVMGEKRRMGKTPNSIKVAAAFLLFSVATVAGKPILMMTLYVTDDYDWIFAMAEQDVLLLEL